MPRERLMMLAQALARNDEAEAKRLHDTTPMKPYLSPDLEFNVPFKVTWHLVYLLSIQLNECIGQLQMIEKMQKLAAPLIQMATLELMPKVLDALEETKEQPIVTGEAHGVTDDNHDHNPKSGEENTQAEAGMAWVETFTSHTRQSFGDLLGEQRSDVVGIASALLVSFDRFTRQVLELDGLTVLRAWMYPVADDLERLGITEHEPDAETLTEWTPVWGNMWNRKMAFQGLSRACNGAGGKS